ncbi:MAG: hypothetical protein QM790_17730 [Nibricoccus sp.]
MKRLFAACSLAFALIYSGCATHHGMATLDENTAAKPTKAVYLLSVTLKNTLIPAYQPKLVSIKVHKLVQSNYPVIQLFETDQQAKNETFTPTTGNTYLLRFELEPGEYSLLGLNSLGESMFISSPFFTPVQGRISASKPGIYYLGHIEVNIRERKGDEFHAGGILPTQEQRLTGGFGGTFDVEITDQWATDEEKFQTRFPALTKATVQKSVLSPFNRARAQAWWMLNNFTEVP